MVTHNDNTAVEVEVPRTDDTGEREAMPRRRELYPI
jgi:hypothetical protein